MSSLTSLCYSLSSEPSVKWTETQEKSISREYPFTVTDLQGESPEQYVVRTYLQFLWLPDSIMPLQLFVPLLLRVVSPSQQHEHPLHALLDPLLLTSRAAANKYHTELPQILSDGGGAGELEEGMMWFAVNHEKAITVADGDENERLEEEGMWHDEKWRVGYLERMERREVQIQILLHFLKLSLPGPQPSESPILSSPKKRKRSSRRKPTPVAPSTEERLESFMDKMSMWQLVMALDTSDVKGKGKAKDDRDWMQAFTEDIIESQFQSKLPSTCALLRSKVFPNSPFSDDTDQDPSSSRSSSPLPPQQPPNKRARSSSTALNPNRDRSRSRSLSVSLAQERSESVGVSAATKKRTLNREVSMSRVFKDKKKDEDVGKSKEKDKSSAIEKKGITVNRTGVTLVEATPVKARSKSASQTQTHIFRGPGLIQSGAFANTRNKEAEEDYWDIPSSPDILLLGSGSQGYSDGEGEMVVDEGEERLGANKGSVLIAATPMKSVR